MRVTITVFYYILDGSDYYVFITSFYIRLSTWAIFCSMQIKMHEFLS